MFKFVLPFIVSCGSVIPTDFIKPTINKKIALTIKNYQSTKCLTHCLVDKFDDCYVDIETDQKRCVKTCPLEYKAFKCTDLYPNKNGKRNVYWISPWEWQNYIEHLTVITFLDQDVARLSQDDFLCNHDFILCENHREIIETLREYVIDLKETKK